MSQKNNLPIIVAVVAVLVIAGGAMFYFSKNMTKDVPVQEASAPADTTAPSTASSTNSSTPSISEEEQKELDSAAGGVIDGVTVEPGNPVVAKVDGKDVTRVDVVRYIKMMPANIQQMPPSAIYPLALDQVVNTRLVQNKADDAGLESDPEVQEQMDMAKQQIVRSIYVQREVDKQISESDLKNAYDEFNKKTPDVEEIKASHILVDSEEKAKDIIAKLNAGGNFATLAAENSGDPGNKDKGGELGWFGKADMVKEFADAAFKMEPGKISETPVKTQFGWHVVKVEEKRVRPRPSFEELKPMLQVELRRGKLEAMLEDWRKSATIEKFDINGNPVKAAAKEEAPAAPVSAPATDAVAPAAGDAPATEAPAPAAAE